MLLRTVRAAVLFSGLAAAQYNDTFRFLTDLTDPILGLVTGSGHFVFDPNTDTLAFPHDIPMGNGSVAIQDFKLLAKGFYVSGDLGIRLKRVNSDGAATTRWKSNRAARTLRLPTLPPRRASSLAL